MLETELIKMVEAYKSHLVQDGKLDERLLMALCREIERETRHFAVKGIYTLAGAVSNREEVKVVE